MLPALSLSREMNEEVKQRIIKPGDEFLLTFPPREAPGLILLYEGDNECISIEQLTHPAHTGTPDPGTPEQYTYRIKGVKSGKALLHFFDTRIWDAGFGKITVKEISVEVAAS